MLQSTRYTETKTSLAYGIFTRNPGEGSRWSGLNADGCQRILSSMQFRNLSSDLRKALYRRTTILTVPWNLYSQQIETAIHAMTDICWYWYGCSSFAEKAFNSINCKVMLYNVKFIFPITATYIINFFQLHLLLVGERYFLAREKLKVTHQLWDSKYH